MYRRFIPLFILLCAGLFYTAQPAAASLLDDIVDTYYPDWGNTGYDVQHYTLDLTVDVPANSLSGTASIRAKATADLESFSLDLRGLEVTGVTVNDEAVAFSRAENKLLIQLNEPIADGEKFTTEVTYAGSPQPFESKSDPTTTIGWMAYQHGIIVLGEPDGASNWYPVNNRPSDKAAYTFRITVAEPYTVFANGELLAAVEEDGKTTYIWNMPLPMSSYLAVLSISPFPLRTEFTPEGIPIHYQYAPELDATVRQQLHNMPEMLSYLSDVFGPYPFESYGVVVLDVNAAPDERITSQWQRLYGLESQGFSILFLDDYLRENIVVHELAHQWFGGSVGIMEWRDLWLKEGFASYSEWLWAEHLNGRSVTDRMVRNRNWYESFLNSYEHMPPGSPPIDNLYHPSTYIRGAVTLEMLRRRVGDEDFFSILSAYTGQHRYGSATLDDLTRLAESVSGQELDQFFETWIYSTQLPAFSELAGG